MEILIAYHIMCYLSFHEVDPGDVVLRLANHSQLWEQVFCVIECQVPLLLQVRSNVFQEIGARVHP